MTLPATVDPDTSASVQALHRIMEVREPITGRLPRGWNTVGLQETLAFAGALLLGVAIVAGGLRVGTAELENIGVQIIESVAGSYGLSFTPTAPNAPAGKKFNPFEGKF